MTFEIFDKPIKPRRGSVPKTPPDYVVRAQKEILEKLLFETYGKGKTNCSETDIKNLIAKITWQGKS